MSWSFQKIEHPVARKEYTCDAYDCINNAMSYEYFTWQELAVIGRVAGRIKKGERHLKVSGKWGGEFCCFRANLELHAICVKHDLYPED